VGMDFGLALSMDSPGLAVLAGSHKRSCSGLRAAVGFPGLDDVPSAGHAWPSASRLNRAEAVRYRVARQEVGTW
jgi:hypothetical protein